VKNFFSITATQGLKHRILSISDKTQVNFVVNEEGGQYTFEVKNYEVFEQFFSTPLEHFFNNDQKVIFDTYALDNFPGFLGEGSPFGYGNEFLILKEGSKTSSIHEFLEDIENNESIEELESEGFGVYIEDYLSAFEEFLSNSNLEIIEERQKLELFNCFSLVHHPNLKELDKFDINEDEVIITDIEQLLRIFKT